ncbi:hypothetical protein V1505DRAFT_294507, partial [Lipomyces doorenjongii]
KAEPNLLSFVNGKERLTHQQLLENNILRRIVAEKQSFTTLESLTVQQNFQVLHFLPPVKLVHNGWPMSSRHNV